MNILYQGNILIDDVVITQAAEHEEELMKSDFVRLSWDSATGDVLPVDAYIEPFDDGVQYRLFEPYTPEQKSEDTYHYEPQFQHPKMYLSKVPFVRDSYDTERNHITLMEWSYTGFIGTLLEYFCNAINAAFGFTDEDVIEYLMVGEFENIVSTTFTAQDILSALSNIANQLECEWHIDWHERTLYFGHIQIDRQELEEPVLEVDTNIGVPSVRNSKSGYWNSYQPQGSTRNITVRAASGENVQANVRLALNKTQYPDGIIYTDGEGNVLTKAQFDALGLTPYIKSVIYESVYPKLDLFVYDVRYRERYLLDDDGNKVIDHYEGSTPVYKRYAVWFMRLAYPTYNQQGEVTGWTDYTIDPETQVIDGKVLMGAFQANTREGAETSPLAGQGSGDGEHYGFELAYHETGEIIPPDSDGEGDTGVTIKAGDYEIILQQKDDFIIPSTPDVGMIPKGKATPSLLGNVVNLYNIVMSDDYLVSAQNELENETLKTIAHDTEDNNTYTFKALETAFEQSNPNLYIGRKVTYRNGGYELRTRVMKLVTKLDYSFEQEITIGNEVLKGNQTTMREKVDTLITTFAQGGTGGLSQNQVLRLIENWVTPRFLSKIKEDTAQGVITFQQGLKALMMSIFNGIKNKGRITSDEADIPLFVSDTTIQGNINVSGDANIGRQVDSRNVKTDVVQSHNYTGEGFADTGYRLTSDDGTGSSALTVDNLHVRKKATFEELEVKKETAIAGNQVYSCAANVITRTDYYNWSGDVIGYSKIRSPWLLKGLALVLGKRAANFKLFGRYKTVRVYLPDASQINYVRCYFLAKDGDREVENMWQAGKKDGVRWYNHGNDLARCQTMNLKNSNRRTYISSVGEYKLGNVYWWRKVINVSSQPVTIDGQEYHYFDVSMGDCDAGSDIPAAGDHVVQFGNDSDPDRMNLIVLEVNGGDAPAEKFYEGIHNYNLNDCYYGGHTMKARLSPKAGYKFQGSKFEIVTEYAVSPVPIERGEWVEGTTYYYYNLVQHNGASWLCVASAGNEYTVVEDIMNGSKVVYPKGAKLNQTQYDALTVEQKQSCTRTATGSTTLEPSEANSAVWRYYAQKGTNGGNTATILLYKRSATPITQIDWSNTLTYTFATKSLNSVPSGWTFNSIPAGSDPIYVTAATAYSTTATDTIAANEWAAPTKYVENGAHGINTAPVFLYQRKASAPTKPSTSLTYTFSTGKLSGTLGSWSQSIPTSNGLPCWVIQATAIASTDTDTIAASEWSEQKKLVEDGTSIKSVVVTYAKQIAAQYNGNPPTSGWQPTINAVGTLNEGDYLWTKTVTSYSDTLDDTTTYTVSKWGIDGDGIDNIETKFYEDDELLSQEQLAALAENKWKEYSQLSLTQGDYIYTRTKITYDKASTPTVSYQVNRIGQDGVGYVGTEEYYCLGDSVTTPPAKHPYQGTNHQPDIISPATMASRMNGGSWSEARPTYDTSTAQSRAKKYLWNFEAGYTTEANEVQITEPICIANYEKGILSIIETYAISAYAVASQAGGYPSDITSWTDEAHDCVPTDAKPYQWNKTETTYTDGTKDTFYHVSAVKGTKGNGIVSITRTFAISSVGTTSSETTEPSHQGSWTANSPSVTEKYPYLWAKEVVVFTDTTKNTTKYYCIGRRGDNGVDAQDIEWVYIRTKTNTAPTILNDNTYTDTNGKTYTSDDHLPQVSGNTNIENNQNRYQCTDDPKGVTDVWLYEWEIKRTKGAASNGHRSWDYYQGTMTLHNNFAQSAFIIDIDNDNDQFGTDSESKVLVTQTRSTTVAVYDGTIQQTLNSLNVTLTYEDNTSVPTSVATSTSNKNTGVVSVTVLQSNTAFSHEAIKATITAEVSGKGTKTSVFTIQKVMSGQPGITPIIYQLAPTQPTFSFSRDASNNLTPPSRTSQINVAKTEGNTTTILSTAQSGITYKWGFDDSATATESNKAIGTSISVTNSNASSHYQVWVELSTGDRETLPIVKDGAKGIQGDKGDKGDAGQKGDNGKDGWMVTADPANVIITQSLGTDTTSFSAQAVTFSAKKGNNDATVTSVLINNSTDSKTKWYRFKGSVSGTTVTVSSPQPSGDSYYTEGYFTARVTVTDPDSNSPISFYITVPCYANLLGTWKETVEADTKTAIAQSTLYEFTGDSGVSRTEKLGEFIASSKKYETKLTSKVVDEDGNIVKTSGSLYEQTSELISLSVESDENTNLVPDHDIYQMLTKFIERTVSLEKDKKYTLTARLKNTATSSRTCGIEVLTVTTMNCVLNAEETKNFSKTFTAPASGDFTIKVPQTDSVQLQWLQLEQGESFTQYNTINSAFKRTGIDIEEGTISLQADKVIISNDLVVPTVISENDDMRTTIQAGKLKIESKKNSSYGIFEINSLNEIVLQMFDKDGKCVINLGGTPNALVSGKWENMEMRALTSTELQNPSIENLTANAISSSFKPCTMYYRLVLGKLMNSDNVLEYFLPNGTKTEDTTIINLDGCVFTAKSDLPRIIKQLSKISGHFVNRNDGMFRATKREEREGDIQYEEDVYYYVSGKVNVILKKKFSN